MNTMDVFLRESVEGHVREVTPYINEIIGAPSFKDPTTGNRCDLLTHFVLGRLQADGLVARRELHIDNDDNWHFLLAHEGIDAEPSNDDIVSDLNPWQWSNKGKGIFHGSRKDVMETLRLNGAPETFIALRGLSTLRVAHHIPKNPFALK